MESIDELERELIEEIRFRAKSISTHYPANSDFDKEWCDREIAIQRSNFRMLVLIRYSLTFRSRHRERMAEAIKEIEKDLSIPYPEFIGETSSKNKPAGTQSDEAERL